MFVSIIDLLRSSARTRPDAVALNVDGDPSLTYAVWDRTSDAAAAALRRLGAGGGKRVGLSFGDMDWADYAACYLGVLKTGATAVHLGSAVDAEDRLRRLTECAVTGLVHGRGAEPPAGFRGWTVTAADLAGGDPEPGRVRVEPTDVADILYTSGTTGPAKALVNPHALLTTNRPPDADPAAPGSPMVCPLPLGSNSSAATVASALTADALPVVCPYGDVERAAALVAELGAEAMMVTPWTATRMAASRAHERHDLFSICRFLSASAPMPTAVAGRLRALAPHAAVHCVYTQSEAVPAVVWTADAADRPHVLGRPGPNSRVRVTDEQARPVPAGTVGEIWLNASGPGRRYLDAARNPDKYRDGWTRTGDLGWLADDGVLHLFDRTEHVISAGGRRISSVAVEEVLYGHPAVREAAVVGLPARGGERVAAFVVLDRPEPAAELRSWLASRLAPPELPERVEALAELPRGLTGKVLKRQLRDAYAG